MAYRNQKASVRRFVFLQILLLISGLSGARAADALILTETDFASGGDRPVLSRTYSSRSMFNGAFGFGWCAEFEEKLEILRDGRLRLRTCENDAGVVFAGQGGGVYVSAHTINERIEFESDSFRLWRDGMPIRRFDRLGRLRAYFGAGRRAVEVIYSRSGLVQELRGADFNVALEMNPGTAKVIGARAGGREIRFFYAGENLVSVVGVGAGERGGIPLRDYAYDELHNLLQVSAADGPALAVRYDPRVDAVIAIEERHAVRAPTGRAQ